MDNTYGTTFNEKLIHLIQTDPIFKKNNNETNLQILRDITFRRLEKIIEHGFIDVTQITENPEPFFKVMNTLHAYDLSLAVKTGVNFGLFGAGLLRLGTYEQVEPYLKLLNEGKIFGALAITEVGHGSNLKRLETTATWDDYTHTFRLHTPHDMATKCWIGNAACHATHAIVYAQLEYKEKDYGLHAFVVMLRNIDGKTRPGIIIEDNGAKKGLNGVDNGKISFLDVEIPRESLLSNFGFVNNSGEYESDYILGQDDDIRFADLLSTLSGGRGVLASGSLIAGIKANIISCKYAKFRRQFSSQDDKPEKAIIDYTSHRYKLLPLVAKSMALSHAILNMKEIGLADYYETKKVTKRVHAFSSGMKVICSEHGETCCRVSREACGGHGYALENELSLMHNDVDIYKTFEGDNTLLRQEVCKYILLENSEKEQGYEKIDDVTNPDFISYVLTIKMKKLIGRLGKHLMGHIQKGCEQFEAWNQCLDIVLNLADTFMYLKIYDIFKDSGESKDWINLFGYDLLIKQTGLDWYLINNVIDSKQAYMITSGWKHLCNNLVGGLYTTLDKFQMPEVFWRVPMLEKCVYVSRL